MPINPPSPSPASSTQVLDLLSETITTHNLTHGPASIAGAIGGMVHSLNGVQGDFLVQFSGCAEHHELVEARQCVNYSSAVWVLNATDPSQPAWFEMHGMQDMPASVYSGGDIMVDPCT